jgi:molybdopterin-guanine dinucleotide biosynthesis protein A
MVDYIALMDDDFNRKLEKYIHKDEVHLWQGVLDAPELSYVFVEDKGDYLEVITEEEYESFKEEHIEEYV